VKKLFQGLKEPGYHTIRSDAKDDMGRRLPQGVSISLGWMLVISRKIANSSY